MSDEQITGDEFILRHLAALLANAAFLTETRLDSSCLPTSSAWLE
jgi:hypothetical protein